ncbi:unnamed protein product [Moneuplotes crassus]|uniref:Ubiquitin-like protease family profile domain-containing protein n=1 Tax=Euplotes crassus TaxID=5936 RepID=A0AAD1U413_EUPCR|nr:unnamed protein product [Moneuplotes crassus]
MVKTRSEDQEKDKDHRKLSTDSKKELLIGTASEECNLGIIRPRKHSRREIVTKRKFIGKNSASSEHLKKLKKKETQSKASKDDSGGSEYNPETSYENSMSHKESRLATARSSRSDYEHGASSLQRQTRKNRKKRVKKQKKKQEQEQEQNEPGAHHKSKKIDKDAFNITILKADLIDWDDSEQNKQKIEKSEHKVLEDSKSHEDTVSSEIVKKISGKVEIQSEIERKDEKKPEIQQEKKKKKHNEKFKCSLKSKRRKRSKISLKLKNTMCYKKKPEILKLCDADLKADKKALYDYCTKKIPLSTLPIKPNPIPKSPFHFSKRSPIPIPPLPNPFLKIPKTHLQNPSTHPRPYKSQGFSTQPPTLKVPIPTASNSQPPPSNPLPPTPPATAPSCRPKASTMVSSHLTRWETTLIKEDLADVVKEVLEEVENKWKTREVLKHYMIEKECRRYSGGRDFKELMKKGLERIKQGMEEDEEMPQVESGVAGLEKERREGGREDQEMREIGKSVTPVKRKDFGKLETSTGENKRKSYPNQSIDRLNKGKITPNPKKSKVRAHSSRSTRGNKSLKKGEKSKITRKVTKVKNEQKSKRKKSKRPPLDDRSTPEVEKDFNFKAFTDLLNALPEPSSRQKIKKKRLNLWNIEKKDLDSLLPEKYLNDLIILSYYDLIRKIMTKDNVHVFDSFFFEKVVENIEKDSGGPINYNNVKNWGRRVELFKNDFWIFTVNKNSHWYMYIVTYPAAIFKKEKSETKRTLILKFDSFIYKNSCESKTGDKKHFITQYITQELLNRGLSVIPDVDPSITPASIPSLTAQIPIIFVKAPQQYNSYDCGVFCLEYTERFLKNPLAFMKVILEKYGVELAKMKKRDLHRRKNQRKREEINRAIRESEEIKNELDRRNLNRSDDGDSENKESVHSQQVRMWESNVIEKEEKEVKVEEQEKEKEISQGKKEQEMTEQKREKQEKEEQEKRRQYKRRQYKRRQYKRRKYKRRSLHLSKRIGLREIYLINMPILKMDSENVIKELNGEDILYMEDLKILENKLRGIPKYQMIVSYEDWFSPTKVIAFKRFSLICLHVYLNKAIKRLGSSFDTKPNSLEVCKTILKRFIELVEKKEKGGLEKYEIHPNKTPKQCFEEVFLKRIRDQKKIPQMELSVCPKISKNKDDVYNLRLHINDIESQNLISELRSQLPPFRPMPNYTSFDRCDEDDIIKI